jgi:hypothetical protein
LPLEQRIARGRALRERCPRRSHGAWTAPAGRRDPVDLLIEQGTRCRCRRCALRMKRSPFVAAARR